MFLDDIFDGKGADDKSNIFNSAELLQNSWSDGSHQQIFAPPNPSSFLPSLDFGSGADRVQAQSFLGRIGLPDLGNLPRLPGLPNPGDLPTPPLPRLGELPLPGLPNPGDLPAPPLPRLGELPQLPELPNPGDLPIPPLPRLGELPRLPRLPGIPTPGDLTPPLPRPVDLPRPECQTPPERPPAIEITPNPIDVWVPEDGPIVNPCPNGEGEEPGEPIEITPSPIDVWVPEDGPIVNPCPIGEGEEPGEPIIITPDPIDVWAPDEEFPIVNPCPIGEGEEPGESIAFTPSPDDVWAPEEQLPIVNPCPSGEGEGQGDGGQQDVGEQGPNYDNVSKQEVKDVLDKYFEDIDGSNANGLQKLFGFERNGRVDSKEIMEFVMKNMDRLSDREIRVLLSASQKEGEISNAYDDEWGAENSGMSRSDIAVWERQQTQVGIPADEIVIKPFERDPSIWMDRRFPHEQNHGPRNDLDKHNDLRWRDEASYRGGSLQNVDKNRNRVSWI